MEIERSLMAWLHPIRNTERLQLRMKDIGKAKHPARLQSYVTYLLNCWVVILRFIYILLTSGGSLM